MKRAHTELEAWKQSMKLVKSIYQDTKDFPREEQFGLTSQIRRAAVSIPANIAEGAARGTQREFKQFLIIARGSLSELETLLLIARDEDFVSGDAFTELDQQTARVSTLLSGLLRSLQSPSPLNPFTP